MAKKKVKFELEAASGSKVSVAGTFNAWNSAQCPMKDNPDGKKFSTTIKLAPGRYEYKFVVNGEWIADPKCSESVQNECGSQNSVLTV